MNVWLFLSRLSMQTKVNHDAGGGIGTEIHDSSAKTFPPLTMLYIAATLERRGHTVRLIDGNIVDEDPIAELLEGSRRAPSAVVLQVALPTVDADRILVQRLRSQFPDLSILCVGTFLDLFAREFLKSGATAVLSGDPELAVASVLEDGESGHIRTRAQSSDLEELPFPAWHRVAIGAYTSHTVLSSRGCSLGCGYCPYRVFQGDSVTARSSENVLHEIRWLREVHAAEYILFRDPIFTYNAARANAIVSGIQCAAPGMEWGCETRFEFLPDSLIASMGVAGCHHVRLGVETARPETLVQAGRIGNPRQAKRHLTRAAHVIAELKAHGIRSVCFFMVGFPDDDGASFDAIRQFVDVSDPDVALLNYATPYPGTAFHDVVMAEGLVDTNEFRHFGSKHVPVVHTHHLTAKELHSGGQKLMTYLAGRNRQFFPIR